MSIIKLQEMVGRRVRLLTGDEDSFGRTDKGLWIAGDVPVGTIGTIQPFTRYLMQIVWDGITPKTDYVFGATDATLSRLEILP